MGGEEGLHRLVDESHKLGTHIMPMYGINVTGTHLNGFMNWGNVSEANSASGNIRQGSVDWDASRHYDHSSGRVMNPGAPKWQNHLVRQIVSLSNEYKFDAAFLDIAAYWENDPNHNVYDGVCRMVKRIHDSLPDFLVTGEAWYDALSKVFPIVQSGHTDGWLNWPDEAYSPIVTNYARLFAHLSLGDPSRLSTGVHELGTNPQWKSPFRSSIIPALTIVDGTIMNAESCVDEIINDAKLYSEISSC